jgi:hypothetical protein
VDATDARFLLCRSAERLGGITDDIEELLETGDPDIESILHRLLTELGQETENAQRTLVSYLRARIKDVMLEEQEHGGLL